MQEIVKFDTRVSVPAEMVNKILDIDQMGLMDHFSELSMIQVSSCLQN